MNTTHQDNGSILPDVPIPAGAATDDWCTFAGVPEDLIRFLTWSRHDTDKVGVAVDGSQLAYGTVERMVSLDDGRRPHTSGISSTIRPARHDLGGLVKLPARRVAV